MLKFYSVLASWLYRMRLIVWLLAALGLAGFALTVFYSEGRADEAYMLAAIALLLWSMCLLVVLYTFIHPLPVVADDDKFFRRMRKRLARGMRWAMAWVTTLLFLAVMYVSFRAGSIALSAL